MDSVRIDELLSQYQEVRGNLIEILHKIQAHDKYLPEDALIYVSRKTGVPITRLYSLATFYHLFHLTPQGRHSACVCLGTACHVKGSAGLLDEVERRLGAKEGETTEDMRFTIGAVRCVGACSLAPVMIVDNKMYGGMTSAKVPEILKKYK